MQLNIRKSIALLLSTAALSVGSIGLFQSEAKAQTATDLQYLEVFQYLINTKTSPETIRYSQRLSRENAIGAGYELCQAIDNGYSIDEYIASLHQNWRRDGFNQSQIDILLEIQIAANVAGVNTYCPWHVHLIRE